MLSVQNSCQFRWKRLFIQLYATLILVLPCSAVHAVDVNNAEESLGIAERVNDAIQPAANGLSDIVFFKAELFGTDVPLIVLWLILAAVFFTVYFNFLSFTGFRHAFELLTGKHDKGKQPGEISHFQALATAVSGTVGIGNIGGVAIVISIGGPGAIFWMIAAGFFGMSTKFAECVAGVKFRRINADGSVSGGPMYYIEAAFRLRNLSWAAKPLGCFYAAAIVIGCLGIGNMFQSNQAFQQFLFITGGEQSQFQDYGWLFGLVLAMVVASVILGGLKSIARVTSKMVPFMALFYIVGALAVIFINVDKVPWAFKAIFTEAFDPQAMGGGIIGVMILGFQRAVFSNEAGIGSAAIAHSAVKTDNAVTEGYVGLMEPFIDTVVICTLTALVILTTVYTPELVGQQVQGVELTSSAFGSAIGWSVVPLSFIAVLFAFSTLIAWSYYGLKGWTYLVGESKLGELVFKIVYCGFAVLGCVAQLDAVLSFSDSMVFIIALPNLIALYLLSPLIKEELKNYQQSVIKNDR